jgi:hypothetical protein
MSVHSAMKRGGEEIILQRSRSREGIELQNELGIIYSKEVIIHSKFNT